MNISQLLQANQGNTLGPVKVKKAYPLEAGKPLGVMIEDFSGSTRIAIFGMAREAVLNDNDVITITANGPRGAIKKNVYNNKESLTAFDCKIEYGNTNLKEDTRQAAQQSQPAERQAYQGSTFRSQPASSDLTERDRMIVDKWVSLTDYALSKGMQMNWPDGFAEKFSSMIPSFYHQSFCAQKGLGDNP